MDKADRRVRIRRKLAEGRLPRNTIKRVGRAPANEEMCDGCGEIVPKGTMIMEGVNPNGQRIHFHLECFYIWDQERRFPRLAVGQGTHCEGRRRSLRQPPAGPSSRLGGLGSHAGSWRRSPFPLSGRRGVARRAREEPEGTT